MVKSVIGDETQLKSTEDRLSQSSPLTEVGLVIGKLSSVLDRGFVYTLIPTPPNDAGEPACSLIAPPKDDKKKGAKSKSQIGADSSSLRIDHEWVAEHARQVSRMLVGGMKVVGIYVWANDNALKNSTIVLCQTVKGIAEAASTLETKSEEKLLIHICYSPRRWSCRNCLLTSNFTSSSLQPCDFKMGRVLTSLQTYRCMYKFDLRLPVYHKHASAGQTMSDILRHATLTHAKELNAAKAVIDGNLVVDEEMSTSDGLHEVELFHPFMNNSYLEACGQKNVAGVLVFRGSVCSFAHLNSKESVLQAVEDIKEDIIASLLSRLDIICDEVDDNVSSPDDGGKEASNDMSAKKPTSESYLHLLRERYSLSLPRRVLIPWLTGAYICDYLQPFEKLEVVADHCIELMSMEALTDLSSILEPESEATPLFIESIWDVSIPSSSASHSVKGKGESSTPMEGSDMKTFKWANNSTLAAVLILIISIIVGIVLHFSRSSL